jgi:hypothetical protein
MTKYLAAAVDAVETLIKHQSARAGGRADGELSITVTTVFWDRVRTVGALRGEKLLSYDIQGMPMEMRAVRMDMGCWNLLKRLSDATGDDRYRELVKTMARVFTRHGYEAVSGLGYLGEEGNFDVEGLSLKQVYMSGPQFKPLASTPLEDLWEAGPGETARLIRSAYLGLVTDAETMSFNRHCFYGFDDKPGKLANEFNSHHAAFGMSAVVLLEWWGFLYGKTGEGVWLERAQAMADKWQRAQHPVTGLMPGWFGNDNNDEPVQRPRDTCNNWDTLTGLGFLKVGESFKRMPGGQALGAQMTQMGLGVMRGMARYGYDAETGEMAQWLNLDGSKRTHRAWYTFHTEEEKAGWVAKDPILSECKVFAGYGFYDGLPWVSNAGVTAYGSNVPHHTALAASLTGDAYLLERAELMADAVMVAARGLTSEFNQSGQWTVTANASYVKMMLRLYEATGKGVYLERAREIADIEMGLLAKAQGPHEWWRLPLRNMWIEALIELDAAMPRTA